MTDDLPFEYEPAPANPAAPPSRKCRRHDWMVFEDLSAEGFWKCIRCGRPRDAAASRRGRTNRNRGNKIERWVCKILGIPRVGQFGSPTDGGDSSSWLQVQVKSGGAYPERIDLLLRAITVNAAQLRGVVHVDTPGPGTRRRALITLDLGEFAEWFGTVDDRHAA